MAAGIFSDRLLIDNFGTIRDNSVVSEISGYGQGVSPLIFLYLPPPTPPHLISRGSANSTAGLEMGRSHGHVTWPTDNEGRADVTDKSADVAHIRSTIKACQHYRLSCASKQRSQTVHTRTFLTVDNNELSRAAEPSCMYLATHCITRRQMTITTQRQTSSQYKRM